MYARSLIAVLVLCVGWSMARPDTCEVDADCPLTTLPFSHLQVNQKCIDRDCQIQVRGDSCGRCNEPAVNGQCCDVEPDDQGQCQCVEPACVRKTDCFIPNSEPPAFAECIQGVCTSF